MNTPFFSIIIPVYNGHDVIGRALDSIYSQGLASEDFEIICVDDCSPTLESYEYLNNYVYDGVHPLNLKVLCHEVNKRQGGARNTALLHADGEYILYCDQDDFFVERGLCPLLASMIDAHPSCDLIMFDYQLMDIPKSCQKKHIHYAAGFEPEEVYSGINFIKKFSMPWTPWCYAYKRTFLIKNQILFAENVRFEDIDYVVKSTLLAEKIKFLPIDVLCHVESGENTSFVGNDRCRIEDLFKISIRIKEVAEDFIDVDKDAALAAMGHHVFHYHWLLKSLLWRLPYNVILEMLKKYVPYEGDDKLNKFVHRHPCVYAAMSQIVRPILLGGLWIKNVLRYK